MHLRVRLIVVALLAALGLPNPALAGQRVALVVGEGAYTAAGRLNNPPRDAELVRKALEQDGFATIMLSNATHMQFKSALRNFRDRAESAEIAVVYYAGHGIEEGGKNWLIPVDARLSNEYDLGDEAIELDRVLEASSGAKLRVVVLDACRNNPFGADWKSAHRSITRGLARVEVDDVMVLYAAAPGQTASDGNDAHSPFAASLAHRLVQPGLALQLLGGVVRDDVLAATGGAQRPFVSASITGNPIYLVGGDAPTQPPLSGLSARPDASEVEALFWKSVSERNLADGYQNYLHQFPAGVFALEARARLAALPNLAKPANAAVSGTSKPQTGHGFLNVRLKPLDDERADYYGIARGHGDFVQDVVLGGAAKQGEIYPGDIIMKVNGEDVTREQPTRTLLRNIQPGQRIPIVLARGGTTYRGRAERVYVTLDDQPLEESFNTASTPAGPSTIYYKELGLQLFPLTAEVARNLKVPEKTIGMVIDKVDRSSDAGHYGFTPGMIIVSANGLQFSASSVIKNIINKAKTQAKNDERPTLHLKYMHPNRTDFFDAELQLELGNSID